MPKPAFLLPKDKAKRKRDTVIDFLHPVRAKVQTSCLLSHTRETKEVRRDRLAYRRRMNLALEPTYHIDAWRRYFGGKYIPAGESRNVTHRSKADQAIVRAAHAAKRAAALKPKRKRGVVKGIMGAVTGRFSASGE